MSSSQTGRRPIETLEHTSDHWQLKTTTLKFGRLPALMGIVNVTPDSFSDGGKFFERNAAVEHALLLAEQGAELLDIGGESTRPYSTPVELKEELRRVVPVIERVVQNCDIPVSVDTSKSEVAREALAAGAEIINDVTGLEGDEQMLAVAIDTRAAVCVMHMQGTPQTMQMNPKYDSVVDDISRYLAHRKQILSDAGIAPEKICLDPGIGFGKTHRHNLELIAGCKRFHQLESPILIGHSRKGFVHKTTGDNSPEQTTGTLAITLSLAASGIQVIRLHDVQAARQALQMWDAIGCIDGTVGTV